MRSGMVARIMCDWEALTRAKLIAETTDTRTAYNSKTISVLFAERAALVEVESNFDLYAAVYRLAAGTDRRTHLPILHLRKRLFFQAQPGALDNHWRDYAPIRGDCHIEQDRPLILGFARFI